MTGRSVADLSWHQPLASPANQRPPWWASGQWEACSGLQWPVPSASCSPGSSALSPPWPDPSSISAPSPAWCPLSWAAPVTWTIKHAIVQKIEELYITAKSLAKIYQLERLLIDVLLKALLNKLWSRYWKYLQSDIISPPEIKIKDRIEDKDVLIPLCGPGPGQHPWDGDGGSRKKLFLHVQLWAGQNH